MILLAIHIGNMVWSKNATRSHRFGFNGQEKDDEVQGAGMAYTAEFWEYDPRSGRRWNLDPITYPWQSSYSAFNNNPIVFVDPYGLEGDDPISKQEKRRRAQIARRNEREWKKTEKELRDNPMIAGQYNKTCNCIPDISDVNVIGKRRTKVEIVYPWEIDRDSKRFSWFEQQLMKTDPGRGLLYLDYLVNKNPGGYTLTSSNTDNPTNNGRPGDPSGEINVDDMIWPGGGANAPRFVKFPKGSKAKYFFYYSKKVSEDVQKAVDVYDNVNSQTDLAHGTKKDSVTYSLEIHTRFGPHKSETKKDTTVHKDEYKDAPKRRTQTR